MSVRLLLETPAGTQASGNQGTIIAGPQTASLSGTSYTWWNVNFDTGTDGWVADIALTVVTAPGTPSLSSPANGASISGTAVTLSWNAVSGAGAYSVGLRDTTTNVLANIPLQTGTSFDATVIGGHSYAWDVASCISSGGADNTTNCPNRSGNRTFTVGNPPPGFYLSFPLAGTNQNTVVINSVFDHSATGSYAKDAVVVDYKNEKRGPVARPEFLRRWIQERGRQSVSG